MLRSPSTLLAALRVSRRKAANNPILDTDGKNLSMARPQKGGEDKRDVIIRVRFTAAEKNKLLELAQNAGLTPSDFIRVHTVGGKAKITKATPVRSALINLTAELNKVGSNVNQIARAINRREQTGEPLDIPGAIIEYSLKEFTALAELIAKELGYGD